MRHWRRRRAAGMCGVAALSACLGGLTHGAVDAADPTPAASGTAVTGTSATAVPSYWQAPALPTAVINGGAIPPGWQPQAVPYHGIGPDGRPLTIYVAPTYVFTYQAGPPVLAVPPVTRPAPVPASVPAGGSGWNYQSQGAAAVPLTLPPQASPQR